MARTVVLGPVLPLVMEGVLGQKRKTGTEWASGPRSLGVVGHFFAFQRLGGGLVRNLLACLCALRFLAGSLCPKPLGQFKARQLRSKGRSGANRGAGGHSGCGPGGQEATQEATVSSPTAKRRALPTPPPAASLSSLNKELLQARRNWSPRVPGASSSLSVTRGLGRPNKWQDP